MPFFVTVDVLALDRAGTAEMTSRGVGEVGTDWRWDVCGSAVGTSRGQGCAVRDYGIGILLLGWGGRR